MKRFSVSSGQETSVASTKSSWNRAHGIRDVTLRGVFSDRPVNSGLCDVKLIAYYVPWACPPTGTEPGVSQWGEVARAVPLFAGHFQPRQPGDLGYYDLRVADVMSRQVELARQYGITAFCFQFYWLQGARPFEAPIAAYLQNQRLDLPFCLCWRNQDLSLRAPNGKKYKLEERYSAEDELSLFGHLGAYLRDPRYLTIHDKPVVAVFDPEALPDARQTLSRWRGAAAEMGLKGLYLVGMKTSRATNLQDLGFDCEAELPPHAAQRRVCDHPPFLARDEAAKTYSYGSLVEQASEKYDKATLWPGVMPSWDSSPTQIKRGEIFVGSSPLLFRKWLDASISRSRRNAVKERFVMVNAWNDWANGAYLEPDDRFGYAYLAACGSAIGEHIQPEERVSELFAAQRDRFRPSRRHAVVLHLFYEDLAEEFAERIGGFGEVDVYITVANDISEANARRIISLFPEAYVQEVANRGRDMLPFLTMLERVRQGNHTFVCKLHAKRSPHLRDGNSWRNELVANLLSQAAREELRAAEKMPKVGILVSKGSLNSLTHEAVRCPSLAARIRALAARKGLATTLSEPFVAGSMFWFRPKAMELFSSLASATEFEPELGQIEGTLSHALERLTIIAARGAGYDVVEIPGTEVKPRGQAWIAP